MKHRKITWKSEKSWNNVSAKIVFYTKHHLTKTSSWRHSEQSGTEYWLDLLLKVEKVLLTRFEILKMLVDRYEQSLQTWWSYVTWHHVTIPRHPSIRVLGFTPILEERHLGPVCHLLLRGESCTRQNQTSCTGLVNLEGITRAHLIFYCEAQKPLIYWPFSLLTHVVYTMSQYKTGSFHINSLFFLHWPTFSLKNLLFFFFS